MGILDLAYEVIGKALIGRCIILFLMLLPIILVYCIGKIRLNENDTDFTNSTTSIKIINSLVLLFIVSVFFFVPLTVDILGLSKYKKIYIEIDSCLVLNKGITISNRRGIFCDDGEIFVYSDYLYVYDLEKSKEYLKGKIYSLKYLPMTKLIVAKKEL